MANIYHGEVIPHVPVDTSRLVDSITIFGEGIPHDFVEVGTNVEYTMATKNVNTEAVQAEETEKKEAVNILDLLLGSDVGEIKLPTKEVEITRLSQVYGAPFILTIKAITPAKFEEIQDMSIDVKGKDADIDITQLQLFTVIEGVVDATGAPMFKNKELMSKFKVSTPKDLVRAILLSGEIAKIYGEISELAGFGDNAVKEVKNS